MFQFQKYLQCRLPPSQMAGEAVPPLLMSLHNIQIHNSARGQIPIHY